MPPPDSRTQLKWLDRIVVAAVVVAFTVAAALVYLVAEAVSQRPLHPVVAAAGEPSMTTSEGVSEGALLPVTPPPPSEQPEIDRSAGIVAVSPDVMAVLPEPSILEWADVAATTLKEQPGHRSVTSPRPEIATDRRMMILLMGVDSRLGHSLVSRTDTLMLMSISPENNRIALLSIPRDLYVNIPGHGRDRINTAFVHGSTGGNTAGGAALAIQTVENALGVAIDHYVLIDFSVLIRTVDALGGIHVYVPYTIDDPTYPDMHFGYDPLYIPEGLHHFDGATALKYARTRHQDNDFYRAQRQQQIILAVRRQVMNMGFIDLVSRAPALYRHVSSGVFTDLSLEEIVQIAWVASEVPADDIHTAVLDYNYVVDHWTERGSQVLLLKHNETTRLIQEMFYDR